MDCLLLLWLIQQLAYTIWNSLFRFAYTVCKMDLILRSIERSPQMQLSMARRFKLQLLRIYSVKFFKMHNFTLGTPWPSKLRTQIGGEPPSYTVRKMDLILRPIERRPQMQFSIARRFKLMLLRRYSVKFYKMRNFMLGTPWLGKLKNTGRRRTSILRICSLWLYHCATITCDTRAVF